MGRLPEESLSLLISVVEGGRSYREVASDLGVASSTIADGRLADLAPTLLALMKLAQPAEMTGASLLR